MEPNAGNTGNGDLSGQNPNDAPNNSKARNRFLRPRRNVTQGAQNNTFVTNPNTPQFFNEAMMASTETSNTKRPVLNKKLLIAAGACAAVLLLLIILVASGVFTKIIPTSDDELARKYASFANYVLWEKETAFMTGSYEKTNPYAIVLKANDNNNEDYYNNVIKKAVEFSDIASHSMVDGETKKALTDYADSMAAWSRLAILEKDLSSLKTSYLENGESKTKKLIDEKYSPLIKSNNEKIKDSGKKLKEASTLQLSIVSNLAEYKCDINNLDDDCKALAGELESKDDKGHKIEGLISEASDVIGEEFLKSLQNSWNYYERLGKKE